MNKNKQQKEEEKNILDEYLIEDHEYKV